MNARQKRTIVEIIIACAFFLFAKFGPDTSMLFDIGPREITLSVIIFFAAYIVVGFTTLKEAFLNIIHGQIFDENFLMTTASIGSIVMGGYSEAVAVMLFYKVGTAFENYAVGKSRKSISELMNIRPEFATLLKDGEEVNVEPESVAIGDVIIVRPGEKVPLDGIVVEGFSSLDTSPLTGESVPRDVKEGEEILSGSVNISGLLKIRINSIYQDSTVAQILEMVENAASRKAPMEKFITRFAKYYTPIVCGAAVLLALVPPIFVSGETFSTWVYRSLIFLVISCPCALVISIPLSFFGGVGAASKNGILVKGSNYLEMLSHAETIIFDKTGTLTTGTFGIISVMPKKCQDQDLLKLAAYGEVYSNHPLSVSIKKAYGGELDHRMLSDVQEIPGKGVSANYSGKVLFVGNEDLMSGEANVNVGEIHAAPEASIVHVAYSGKYMGYIALADTLKAGISEAISNIKKEGIKSTIMLTGDRSAIAESVALQTGIDTAYGQLMPGDKVTLAEKIIEEKSTKGQVVFVGDGINDAPVLARADVGIAMGGLASEAAVEASDIVIMDDDAGKISFLMRIAKRTMTIAKENICIALGIKLIVLILGAFGIADMWLAVFADVGVSIIAILNAMRVLVIKKYTRTV